MMPICRRLYYTRVKSVEGVVEKIAAAARGLVVDITSNSDVDQFIYNANILPPLRAGDKIKIYVNKWDFSKVHDNDPVSVGYSILKDDSEIKGSVEAVAVKLIQDGKVIGKYAKRVRPGWEFVEEWKDKKVIRKYEETITVEK